MTAREIIETYLKQNGYHGLYTHDCGCHVGDLAPCGSDCLECMPGVKMPFDDDGETIYVIGPVVDGMSGPLGVAEIEQFGGFLTPEAKALYETRRTSVEIEVGGGRPSSSSLCVN